MCRWYFQVLRSVRGVDRADILRGEIGMLKGV